MGAAPPPPPFTPPPPPPPPARGDSWQEKPFWQWGGPGGSGLRTRLLIALGGGCLALLVLAVAVVGTIVLVIFGAMKQSDVYQTALARAKTDQRVTAALGTPINEGWWLSGNTEVSGGSGEANLSIPISGPKGKGTIYAVATKSAGQWTYSKLAVKIDSTGETIDLNP